MTLIGKLLAFLNLVVGVGIVTWSVSAYAQRPLWFEPLSEEDKAIPPEKLADRRYETFATLKEEAEAIAKTANLVSGTWGVNLERLKKAEETRDKRRAAFAERLEWAHKGNPKDKDGAAFFATVYGKDAAGKDSAWVDVEKLGPPVVGPDNLPLKGVDGLLKNVTEDTKEIERLALQIAKHRDEYKVLSEEIEKVDGQLVKMLTIREAVLAERFYLDTFEVNVYETRETVLRRKRQLVQRLAELGVNKP